MSGRDVVNHIARWTRSGSGWKPVGLEMNDWVFALVGSGTNMYAGGWFTMARGSPANHAAQWNGSSWAALGSGTDGPVLALAASGGDLYAGGYFTNAGGANAN